MKSKLLSILAALMLACGVPTMTSCSMVSESVSLESTSSSGILKLAIVATLQDSPNLYSIYGDYATKLTALSTEAPLSAGSLEEQLLLGALTESDEDKTTALAAYITYVELVNSSTPFEDMTQEEYTAALTEMVTVTNEALLLYTLTAAL